jgi:hypothetical protein
MSPRFQDIGVTSEFSEPVRRTGTMWRYQTDASSSRSHGADHEGPAPGKRTLTMGYRAATTAEDVDLFTPAETVSAPASNDACEQEADRVAAQVVSGGARGAITGGAVEVRHKSAGGELSPTTRDALDAAGGAGHALPGALQQSKGRAFGADLGDVRIHTGSGASELNHAAGARAMAHGRDVFFGAGEYDPGSRAGQELIAHELTHVIQQRGGAPGLDFKMQAAITKKKVGLHEDASQKSKQVKIPSGKQLMVDPDTIQGEWVEAIWGSQVGYVKLRKVTLQAEEAKEDPAFAARGADHSHATGRFLAEDEEGAVAEGGAFAGRGAMAHFTSGESKEEDTRSKVTGALDLAGKVTGFGASMAIDKAVGVNLKGALPMSNYSKVKAKIGQVVTMIGALPGAAIPVVGEIIGAPLTAMGTALEASGQGMTAKQALGKGAATAGAGAVVGLIPVWGQIDGAVGLASAADKVFSGFDSPTKQATIAKLREIKAGLDAAQTEAGDYDLMQSPQYRQAYRLVEQYLEKYGKVVEAKEDAGSAGLLKYAAPDPGEGDDGGDD